MDPRTLIELKTSWASSLPLENVLYIKNSSGIIIDEPLASKVDQLPLLTRSDSENPCFIYVDCSGLRGYNVVGLYITSGSRTVECYGPNEEYVCTTRGVPCEQAYKCTIDLSSDKCINYSLKLVSLQGKVQVPVIELGVIVTENRGGELDLGDETTQMFPQGNIQDLVSMLPSENVPAFLPGLISSLQDIEKSSTIGSTDKLSQLSNIFQLMRPPVNPVKSVSEATNTEKHEKVNGVGNECTELETKIDKHILEYIDKKFENLENKMEERIGQLKEEIISSILERL